MLKLSISKIRFISFCLLVSLHASATAKSQVSPAGGNVGGLNEGLVRSHSDQEHNCHDSAIGKAEKAKASTRSTKVYTWKDKNGVTHFSQRQPNEKTKKVEEKRYSYSSKNIRGGNFDLKINLEKNSKGNRYTYEDDLERRVRNMYSVMQSLLPNSGVLKVRIDLWLFLSYPQYREFYRKYYPNSRGNISGFLGFYLPKHYIATAWQRNGYDQLMKTAIHEATHVFNHANFGRLPRWLNEGLAEYIEQITPSYDSFQVDLNMNAINSVKKRPLKLSTFLDKNSWRRYGSNVMYTHSWALIFFLFSSDEGKNALGKVLSDYQAVSCEESISLDAGTLLSDYYGGIEQLQTDFSNWLNSTKSPQFY